MINTDELFCGRCDKLDITGNYLIPDNYLSLGIKKLKDVHVSGFVYLKDAIIFANLKVTGEMLIEDSISTLDVYYPFSFEFDENIEDFVQNNENAIDIIELLWQNIVLEVPLRYTKVESYESFSKEGWRLISEEDAKNRNNPFSVLLEDKDGSD